MAAPMRTMLSGPVQDDEETPGGVEEDRVVRRGIAGGHAMGPAAWAAGRARTHARALGVGGEGSVHDVWPRRQTPRPACAGDDPGNHHGIEKRERAGAARQLGGAAW